MTPGEFIVGFVFVVLVLVSGELLGELKAKEQVIITLLERIPIDDDLRQKLESLKDRRNFRL